MDFVIWSLESIGLLLSDSTFYGLVGLIGFAVILATIKIFIK